MSLSKISGERQEKMREVMSMLDDMFPGVGCILVVADEERASVISNISADDVVEELVGLIDNMKEAGHGPKH